MDQIVFQQVVRFLNGFSIETGIASAMIATSPLGLHPLQKIAALILTKPRFLPPDQRGDDVVEAGTYAKRERVWLCSGRSRQVAP